MSSQRFAPEFKDEAVRQALGRGHPVTEVAQCLGVLQSAEDVRKLEDALNAQPDVKENHGLAYFNLNTCNGERNVVPVEEMIRRGVVKGCTELYFSVESG